MSKSLSEMGKEELRAACRTAGISYGKLNNDGMRAALEAKQAEQGIGAAGSDGRPRPAAQLDPVAKAQLDEYLKKTEAAPAPKTKIATLNVETGVVTPVLETPVVREKVTGTVVKPKSLKIEKGRVKQNGVTQPSTGSICRAIWDALDASRAATKAVPTFENLRDLMKQYSWARNTAMTQYQRWKQFNGVMPRNAEAEEAEEVSDGQKAEDDDLDALGQDE